MEYISKEMEQREASKKISYEFRKKRKMHLFTFNFLTQK